MEKIYLVFDEFIENGTEQCVDIIPCATMDIAVKVLKRRYEWYKRCYDVIERSSNPNVKTHSLGTQSQRHINSIPFTSADATSWILSAGNGTLFTKYGTLYVSDHGLNLKKNIANGIAVDTIKEYFESKGFTLDELASSSSERVKWNLMYLGDWAKYERKYIGPKSFKIRRLF